jgi:AAHS family benzoate transporter-like MFS transporter
MTNASGTAQPTSAVNVNKWLDGARFNRFHSRVFFMGMGIFTCDGYDLVIYGAAVPLLMKAFRMGPAQAGAIASWALIGAMIGAPLFGSIADTIGRKKIIIFCTSLFSVAMGLTGFTNGPFWFAVLRFLVGLGFGGTTVNVIAVASEYSPGRNRTVMGGVISGGMQVGGIAAALIAMWLFPLFGWRSVFFVGVIPLLAMPLYGKFFPESPLQLVKSNRLEQLREYLRKARPDEPLSDQASFEVNKLSGKAPVAAVFQAGRAFSTVVLWIMFFMNLYIIFGFTVWLPKLMMNAGFSLMSSLFFLLVLQFVSLVGVVIFGMIADKIGGRPALVVAYVLAFICIYLIGSTHNFALLTLLVGLSGFGFNGAQAVANGYLGSYYPPAMRSTGVGLSFGFGRLGAILGPTLTGVLISLHVSFQANLVALGAPGLIAAICILLIRDKHNFARQQRELRAQAQTA